MRFAVIDIECYFDNDYTFSKMTTESFTRDARFSAHGAAVKWCPDQPAVWYDEPALRQFLKDTDWSDVFLISHHAQWDHLALSHWYGVTPKMSGCTLSMARLLLGNHLGVSLDSVRKHFGMSPKVTPYKDFIGKKWHEMSPQVQQAVAVGACDEVESIWKIFCLLMKEFPREELATVDVTIKMFTQPVLRADTDLLARIWEKENDAKAKRLAELGIDPSELQSAAKFQALLEAEGVEIEYKDGKNGPIPCFAKSDTFMEELLDDDDDRIRALAEARLGAKSTLLQTRAETYGYMAKRGAMCVYLRMYGAHTTRWSGGDKANWQNLKKDDPEYPRAKGGLNIRDAILPPPGFELLKPDASQIECRILNHVAGQQDVIERFRNGEDPYVNVASQFYGYAVNKKDHPRERQVGKVLELQAGYGSGAGTIARTLRRAGIELDDSQALKARDAYRDTHPQVVDLWKQANRMLARLAGGPPVDWGPVHVRDGRIYLPNGCPLLYETLEYYRDPETGEEYWRLKTRHGWSKMYGAKLVENLIQALARVVIGRVMIRVAQMGYRVVNTEHDSLWVLIPSDGQREAHVRNIRQEMIRTPDWAPNLPLDCEVH